MRSLCGLRRHTTWILAAILCGLASCKYAVAKEWPWALPLAPRQQPHPAVVRVNVEEADGIAHGSGTLVDVRDQFGMVITNWHVVRDATGTINVVFPDGFRSAARVLRVDRDWDLAALLIWRPNVQPVPIAPRAPQPGDRLTIAGYGSGDYRAVAGRCTQYVAPSNHHPFEMVEVAASARQGDSGGPILNESGQLAGVLFGSGSGTTSGSYAGRVHRFLSTAWPPAPGSEFPQAIASAPRQTQQQSTQRVMQRLPTTDLPPAPAAAPAPLSPLPQDREQFAATEAALADADGAVPARVADTGLSPVEATTLTWQDIAGEGLLQQGKTFLAILGLFTLIAQFTRLFAPRGA